MTKKLTFAEALEDEEAILKAVKAANEEQAELMERFEANRKELL